MTTRTTTRRRQRPNEEQHDHSATMHGIATACGIDPDHVMAKVAELVRAGVSPSEARRRAIASALILWPTTRTSAH